MMFFSFIYAYFLRNFSIFLNAHPGALWQLQHPTYPSFIPLLGELNRCLKFHWPTHTVFDYFELGVWNGNNKKHFSLCYTLFSCFWPKWITFHLRSHNHILKRNPFEWKKNRTLENGSQCAQFLWYFELCLRRFLFIFHTMFIGLWKMKILCKINDWTSFNNKSILFKYWQKDS